MLTVDLGKYTVTSEHKLPNSTFEFNPPRNFNNHETKLIIGDFNCHSQNWGYTETGNDGHELEAWAEINKMTNL